MDGSNIVRSQSPDWRYTHTAANINKNSNPTNPSAPVTSTILKNHASLPSLAYLDITKIKRDNQDYHESPKNMSPITTTSILNPPLNSPASGYPGPPPPYSSLATTPKTPSVRGGGGYLYHQTQQAAAAPLPPSPPVDTRRHIDERRTVEEERQLSHSLPSIHEALGKEPNSYHRSSTLITSIPPPQPSMTAISPTTPLHRSHAGSISSQPPNSYESYPPRPAPDIFQRDPRVEHARRYPDPPPPTHRIPDSPRPAPPRVQSQSHPSTPSFFDHSRSHPAYAPPQPSSSQTTQYPPAYSYPPPTSYQGQQQPSSSWRLDPPRPDYPQPDDERSRLPTLNTGRRTPPAPYHHGESVKRHLETFDLELGLNELSEGSSRTLEFSRKYIEKSHHMHRSGIATALPTLAECDEMYSLQRSILNSMDRIRELVVTQHHALAEQRSREEANKARQSSYAGQASDMYDKDDSGGFAGSDPKKRRGRHAPPGRCHSCARSETPEWRRGPDGARTLCNACGLHYAKLTRKLGSKGPIPSSNLRPKEADHGSP